MQIFYAPEIDGNTYLLDEKESGHCIRVLRMRRNTTVRLIDGRGNLYQGTISNPDPEACEIKIDSVINDFEKRPYHLHIAISLLKNPERFEWFIEKSVEIGIDEITPVLCKNTEKRSVKAERINNIIISAMKQSLKAGLTRFNNIITFEKFITGKFYGEKLIAHCSRGTDRQSINNICRKGTDTIILIGPEGDFTEDEILSAVSSGFRSVHLGTSRLRTETAGVAACHSIYFLNQ